MSATHQVLFACEANICRSALMEATFLAGMPIERWRAHSAGTNTRPGVYEMCGVAAEVAGVDARTHIPVQLTRKDIEGSHLIIAASRAVRADIATLAPGMRWKIFTLRELNLLAASAPTEEERPATAGGSRHVDDLERYAIMLHRRRGLEPSPVHRWGRLWGRRRPHPFDIDDVHGGRLSAHRTALEGVVADVRELTVHLSEAITVVPS